MVTNFKSFASHWKHFDWECQFHPTQNVCEYCKTCVHHFVGGPYSWTSIWRPWESNNTRKLLLPCWSNTQAITKPAPASPWGFVWTENFGKMYKKEDSKKNWTWKRILHLTDLIEDENGTQTKIDRNVTLTHSRMPSCTFGLQISFIANHSEGNFLVCVFLKFDMNY